MGIMHKEKDMNHELHIIRVIAGLEADKSIPQPYKNYLISDAKRLQMLCRGAKTLTFAKAPEEVGALLESQPEDDPHEGYNDLRREQERDLRLDRESKDA